MSSISMKVLVALLVLVAVVAIIQVAEAQRGYGGYGRGGYGGGRGYYGGGGRGYGGYGRGGYGRGGYGGGYGGGRGYGGYGRGGYGGGYRDTGYSSYGSSSGSYDMTDDDDYSSYMDVYATSSSASQPAVASSGTAASASNNNNEFASTDNQQWQPRTNQVAGVGFQGQWSDFSQNFGGFGATGTNNFDMITGGDSSSQPQVQDGVRSQGPANLDRTKERNVLINQTSRQAGSLSSTTPVVPSSTTTPAPEYVMINPTGPALNSADEEE